MPEVMRSMLLRYLEFLILDHIVTTVVLTSLAVPASDQTQGLDLNQFHPCSILSFFFL